MGRGPAMAQFEADSTEPVEITADKLEWMDNERVAIASGDADAVQGRYRLYADVLTAYLAERGAGEESDTANEIQRIEADGNVRFVTPEDVVTGTSGTYDVANRIVHMEGGVVLTQGENVAHGDRLEMNLDTGVSTLTASASAPGGGRVSALFVPEGDDEAGDDAEASAPGAEDPAE